MRRLMILGSALVMLTTALGCQSCGDCNTCGAGGLWGAGNVHGRCDCDNGPQYGCHHPMAGMSSYGHTMPTPPADGSGAKVPEQIQAMPKEDK